MVFKIGHFDAGFGKMLIDKDQVPDMRSIVACSNYYSTAEEFIDYDIDYRL